MPINAKFIISAQTLEQCPILGLSEFALIGRSNVGKSTFINTIAQNKKLAKTSNKPGKTRLINLFNFDEKFIIADLPGYGYAAVSKDTQAQWQKNLERYLLNRDTLKCLIQFIDARHDVQKNDLQMREWINLHNLPVMTIVTKIDEISRSKIDKTLKSAANALGPEIYPFSKDSGRYADVLLRKLMSLAS